MTKKYSSEEIDFAKDILFKYKGKPVNKPAEKNGKVLIKYERFGTQNFSLPADLYYQLEKKSDKKTLNIAPKKSKDRKEILKRYAIVMKKFEDEGQFVSKKKGTTTISI